MQIWQILPVLCNNAKLITENHPPCNADTFQSFLEEKFSLVSEIVNRLTFVCQSLVYISMHYKYIQTFQGRKGGVKTGAMSVKYFHSGILGFMTLIPTENENILVFEKSKWIRKQKLTSNIGFFLEFFSQLILTTGSQNRSPDIIVYYGIWARVSTKRAVALFSDVIHTS